MAFVGVVAVGGQDGPEGGQRPADQRELQDEAKNALEGPADGEENEPGEEKSN